MGREKATRDKRRSAGREANHNDDAIGNRQDNCACGETFATKVA